MLQVCRMCVASTTRQVWLMETGARCLLATGGCNVMLCTCGAAGSLSDTWKLPPRLAELYLWWVTGLASLQSVGRGR